MRIETWKVVPLLGLLALAGTPALAQPEIDLGTEEQRQAGKADYDKWCSQCHGENGDGRGLAAPYLQPRPRDFTAGKYKIRSTPNGTLPTDEDLARVIRRGIPYTAMPDFGDQLGEERIRNLVYYLKTFAPKDFEDPRAYAEPVTIPDPPAFDQQRALEEGLAAYQEAGCKQCHGVYGRGDGGTAPTLRDDWGYYIRVADLTRPWTFRGGGTREDIYRTLSTGFNGTPMASFDASLSEEQRWLIADWMVAHAPEGQAPDVAPYESLLTAVPVDSLEGLPGDPAVTEELFADAPAALFPVVGQVMQPGRQFHPSAVAVETQAIYDRERIAFRVTWHDMAAETSGHNAPDLETPPYLEVQKVLEAATGSEVGAAAQEPEQEGSGTGGDIWGEDVAGGSGEGGESTGAGGSIWGDQVADEDQGAGAEETEEAPSGGSIWDEPATTAAFFAGGAAGDPDRREFSDAVAIQLPSTLPTGIVRPYFLLGDDTNPVDLWFVDLAQAVSAGEGTTARLYTAHGSDDLAVSDTPPPQVRASYQDGVWSVVFVRDRLRDGVPFQADAFVPIAFSVWDGFQADRGNRRGLTRWFYVYLEPREHPPVIGPMLRAGLAVLAVELLLIFFIRRRRRSGPSSETAGGAREAPQHAAS
jgi:mono/diheme cytochrome c family protein